MAETIDRYKDFEMECSLFKFMVEEDISTPQQTQSFLKYLVDTYVNEDLGKEMKREWRRYLKECSDTVDNEDDEDDDWDEEETPKKSSKSKSDDSKINKKTKIK